MLTDYRRIQDVPKVSLETISTAHFFLLMLFFLLFLSISSSSYSFSSFPRSFSLSFFFSLPLSLSCIFFDIISTVSFGTACITTVRMTSSRNKQQFHLSHRTAPTGSSASCSRKHRGRTAASAARAPLRDRRRVVRSRTAAWR